MKLVPVLILVVALIGSCSLFSGRCCAAQQEKGNHHSCHSSPGSESSGKSNLSPCCCTLFSDLPKIPEQILSSFHSGFLSFFQGEVLVESFQGFKNIFWDSFSDPPPWGDLHFYDLVFSSQAPPQAAFSV
ncbi:MAG: hypothetical protein HYS08_09130 [Chlamydiae bacterium]|nr:hypothetical protein [Chlamydiota bacterium]MBI3265525.1 hypothetical protein [Chlamydiota bacterium]